MASLLHAIVMKERTAEFMTLTAEGIFLILLAFLIFFVFFAIHAALASSGIGSRLRSTRPVSLMFVLPAVLPCALLRHAPVCRHVLQWSLTLSRLVGEDASRPAWMRQGRWQRHRRRFGVGRGR
jgi:hypothetical protein